jgi:hypothetical protein
MVKKTGVITQALILSGGASDNIWENGRQCGYMKIIICSYYTREVPV